MFSASQKPTAGSTEGLAKQIFKNSIPTSRIIQNNCSSSGMPGSELCGIGHLQEVFHGLMSSEGASEVWTIHKRVFGGWKLNSLFLPHYTPGDRPKDFTQPLWDKMEKNRGSKLCSLLAQPGAAENPNTKVKCLDFWIAANSILPMQQSFFPSRWHKRNKSATSPSSGEGAVSFELTASYFGLRGGSQRMAPLLCVSL